MGIFTFNQNFSSSSLIATAGRREPAIAHVDQAAVPAVASPRQTVESMPAAVRSLGMERLAFIMQVNQRRQLNHCSTKDAVLYVAVNQAEEFPRLIHAGQHGNTALSYTNYRNWSRRIDPAGSYDDNVLALCDNYARGLRERKGDDRFWKLFFGLFLNMNRLPLTQAYKYACQKMQKEDKTCPIPSIAQVRYQVNHIEPGQLILAREGEVAYRNKCCDFIRRDWDDVLPGECVVGDSRDSDTMVRVWDETKQRWVAVRPRMAGLLDARSWYIPAYWITVDPVNSETLIDTMRLYLRATDRVPPAVCYFDNGHDYCAQGFSTDFDADGHAHSIFRELGIHLLNSLAYNARAKVIERAFRDIMQQYDKLWPAYLGSNPGDATQTAAYAEQNPEILPSLQQFCETFANWLNTWHNTPKKGQIHKGQSPAEIWARRTANGRPQLSVDFLKMAFLKPVAVRTVGRGPSVKLDNQYYYCDLLTYGQKVMLKADTLNAEHLYCYTLDGCLIGEAVTREKIRALEGDRQAISEMMARQRRQLKTARTVIDDLAGGKQIYSPLELLMAAPDAAVITGKTVASVKGASHVYTHRQLAGVITGADQPAPQAPAYDYQETPAVSPELEKVNQILTRKVAAEDINQDELARVHSILTTHKGVDDDEF